MAHVQVVQTRGGLTIVHPATLQTTRNVPVLFIDGVGFFSPGLMHAQNERSGAIHEAFGAESPGGPGPRTTTSKLQSFIHQVSL